MSKKVKRLPAISILNVLVFLIFVFIVLFVLNLLNIVNIHHESISSKKIVNAGLPVKPPVNKTIDKGTSTKNKINTNNNLVDNGSVTNDQGSNSQVNTSPKQWITSASGIITVKSPLGDAIFSSGSVLAGSAKVNQIEYTLIDNVVGVIDQGQLSVVNGNFSGILHFKSQGTGGRLDVYTTNAQGVQYNEVEINVKF